MLWQTAYASTINLPQASSIAARVDGLHDFLWWISIFSLAGTTIAMLYFTKKYHRSQKGRETAYILGSHTLETLWTVIPLVVMLFVFGWGYRDYLILRTELKEPLEVNVIGRQWMWNFEYANGRKTLNELYLPKGRPVKLIMTSEDVTHSFFVPNFRIKNDVVPGIYTTMSFIPTLTGSHPVRCAEMCGTGHSDMLANAVVLEPKDYDHWYETGEVSGVQKAAAVSANSNEPVKPLAQKGQELFMAKGCFACHSVDGTKKIGPSLAHIWGEKVELADGSTVTVDENYTRESLFEPQKKLVKGYPPTMPTFKGLLTEEEVNSLTAYIKSLK